METILVTSDQKQHTLILVCTSLYYLQHTSLKN